MLNVFGTSYKESDIALREKLHFRKKHLKDAVAELHKKVQNECMILSTCNRIEIYSVAQNFDNIIKFISEYHNLLPIDFVPYSYSYSGDAAMQHLDRVASGQESLIVGEKQIIDQINFALKTSSEVNCCGAKLYSLFLHILHKYKSVDEKEKSIGDVVLKFINRQVVDIESKNISIIGTGVVADLVLKSIKGYNAKVFSNRFFSKAKKLAKKYNICAEKYKNISTVLNQSDVIICATECPTFIIHKKDISEKNQPLIIDLGMPRNVESQIQNSFHLEEIV